MVVIRQEQRDNWAARRTVRSLGVGNATLKAAERANPGLDWQKIVHSLDGVFLAHGGGAGQVHFLRARQETLGGRTPLEVLPQPGGPERLRQAARIFAAS